MTKMGHDHKPDPKAFVDNLKGPMPFQRKLYLLLRNNVRKIVTTKSCCGHPGEPGC
jgi:hypothetical protein